MVQIHPKTLRKRISSLRPEVAEYFRNELKKAADTLFDAENPVGAILNIGRILEGEDGFLRLVAERLPYTLKEKKLFDQIDKLSEKGMPGQMVTCVHWIRVYANDARHPEKKMTITRYKATLALEIALELLKCYYCEWKKGNKLPTIYTEHEVSRVASLSGAEGSLIRRIHLTSMYLDRRALDSLFIPFMDKHHDYEVTATSLCGEGQLDNDNLRNVMNCQLHVFVVGPTNQVTANMDPERLRITKENFIKEFDAGYARGIPYLFFQAPGEITDPELKKKIEVGRAFAFNVERCDPKFLLDELNKFLKRNISEFMEEKGYLDSEAYFDGKIDPILPERRNALYVNGFPTPISKYNQELREAVQRLFLKNLGVSPRAASEFIRVSQQNLDYYVDELECRCAIGYYGVKGKKIVFTDETIGWRDKEIWFEKAHFRSILKSTVKAYLECRREDRDLDFNRIFILDLENAKQLNELFHKKQLIDELIFMQLALGVDVYFYLQKDIKDKIFDGDRNLFLVDKEIVGIIDVKFPYIRVYGPKDVDLHFGAKQTHPKEANDSAGQSDSPGYDDKVRRGIHMRYFDFINQIVKDLRTNPKHKLDRKSIKREISYTRDRTLDHKTEPTFKRTTFTCGEKELNLGGENILVAFGKILEAVKNPAETSLITDFLRELPYIDACQQIRLQIKSILFPGDM